jgi:hypothetical protein
MHIKNHTVNGLTLPLADLPLRFASKTWIYPEIETVRELGFEQAHIPEVVFDPKQSRGS